MTHRELPHRVSSNPFNSYVRQDPFAASAMPARAEPDIGRQEWGAFSLPETVDDETLPPDQQERALEILITWGTSVLHVAHLSPPRSFVVGDGSGSEPVDFVLGQEVLGAPRLPIVEVTGGDVSVTIPHGAQGNVRQGEAITEMEQLLLQASPHPLIPAMKLHTLEEKSRLTMKLGEVKFNVRLVEKSAPVERGLAGGLDWTGPSYFGMTAATAFALMGALAYFVPPLGLTDEADLDKERLVLISHYLDQASEREREQLESPEAESGAQEGGTTGKKAQGAEGQAGKDDAPRVNKRVAVKGPQHNAHLQLSREELLHEATTGGLIGLISSSLAADPHAPFSIFGGDIALGADDISAQGEMWGDAIGESGGRGGLGLMGDGFGGGDLLGNGLGIGLGRVGTIGPGLGKEGFGRSNALTKGGHNSKGPSVRPKGETIVNGHIPPHVIQRIVRQNFGRFRMCYQQGLARNPSLEGRIPVRFVIGRDGAVSNVSAGGDLPDGAVRSCVQSAFYGLSFPPPDDGIVTVTYPIMFSPE